jgi:hypothetical protein
MPILGADWLPRSRPASNSKKPTEAALSPLSGFALHDRDVSIGLVGDHVPTAGEAGEDGGFGAALRQKHEAMTFFGLDPATARLFYFPPGIKEGQ